MGAVRGVDQRDAELIDRRLAFLQESKGAPYLTAERAETCPGQPICPDQVLIAGDAVPRMRSQAETIKRAESFFTGRTVDKRIVLDNGPGPLAEIAPFTGKRLPDVGAHAGTFPDLKAAAEALHTVEREQLLRELFADDYTELGFSPY